MMGDACVRQHSKLNTHTLSRSGAQFQNGLSPQCFYLGYRQWLELHWTSHLILVEPPLPINVCRKFSKSESV